LHVDSLLTCRSLIHIVTGLSTTTEQRTVAKITITIEAATLEEAQAAMQVKAGNFTVNCPDADIEGFVGFDPERSPLSGKDCQELYRGERRLEAPEYAPPKPTAPTVPETEPTAQTAGELGSTSPAPTPPTHAVSANRAGTAPPATGPATSTGVELDADGLPWDSRIHSSSRKKLAKTQQWKKARGVDSDLVERVEAELRQAMAIPGPKSETLDPASPAADPVIGPIPSAPVTGAAVPAPSPSVFAESDAATAFGTQPQPAATIAETTAAPAATAQPEVPTAPASAPTGNGPKTLAELNALVLGAGMQLADVLPAVQKVGLASYALLGTRPDLIPEVARELGLGG
jgi:hypothetical protein